MHCCVVVVALLLLRCCVVALLRCCRDDDDDDDNDSDGEDDGDLSLSLFVTLSLSLCVALLPPSFVALSARPPLCLFVCLFVWLVGRSVVACRRLCFFFFFFFFFSNLFVRCLLCSRVRACIDRCAHFLALAVCLGWRTGRWVWKLATLALSFCVGSRLRTERVVNAVEERSGECCCVGGGWLVVDPAARADNA